VNTSWKAILLKSGHQQNHSIWIFKYK